MENFMNKLAEKFSSQDIIRANSQAEAAENARIKQEAEQYKAQLEEMKRTSEEYRAILEEMRSDAGDYKDQLQEMKEETRQYKEKLEENQTKIHDVGVQVYRNVQAVIEKSQDRNKEEIKDIQNRLETLQVSVETKNSALLPLSIITILLVIVDLVFNILRFLGII
ncbi:hypothetical protein [Butyrivibrio sp. INlla14]|uniref:hypothetical protein n=1 Tax=Butyrivibrio sp. INlla14 TaxID=1520808 RepID=UPI0008773583|nr:hypothetical protein [Butyrivibrio sp. INlla14]SCY33143.1 hypothetical protein SAMN02910371_01878 [Butyrivibrio sp. INlla14]